MLAVFQKSCGKHLSRKKFGMAQDPCPPVSFQIGSFEEPGEQTCCLYKLGSYDSASSYSFSKRDFITFTTQRAALPLFSQYGQAEACTYFCSCEVQRQDPQGDRFWRLSASLLYQIIHRPWTALRSFANTLNSTSSD